MLSNVVYDIFKDVGLTCYFSELPYEEFLASLAPKFEVIVKHLNGKTWLAGEELIWVDFMFAPIVD